MNTQAMITRFFRHTFERITVLQQQYQDGLITGAEAIKYTAEIVSSPDTLKLAEDINQLQGLQQNIHSRLLDRFSDD